MSKLEFSEDCIYGEIYRIKFNIENQRTKETLDYVQLNILGQQGLILWVIRYTLHWLMIIKEEYGCI